MPLPELHFQIFDIASPWVLTGEKRLDARFYAEDVIAARVLLSKLGERGITIKFIADFSANIFWPGRFKRTYVSKQEGTPFLMPSEVIMFLPKATKFITNYPNELTIKENWLLITRSGSIGRCVIAPKIFEHFVVSDDLIRVIPKNEQKIGYVYAYLNSWMGQALLSKDKYGATVKHIEPYHVATIPIPIHEVEGEINQRILTAQKLREEAQILLLQIEALFYSELGLPEIGEDSVEYFGGEQGKTVRGFEVNANTLDFRLDARYSEPIVQNVKANIFAAKFPSFKLASLTTDLFLPPRFKRPYVKREEEGVPFLSGAHLTQLRPFDIKYLRKDFNKLDLYRIYPNWILISARGTVGRPYLVTSNGLAASDNLIRCIPNSDQILPSYLTAYLSTPYASYQIQAQKAGSVQDLLQPIQLGQIYIVTPPLEVQQKIGDLTLKAYTKRDKANKIEVEAIRLLEDTLNNIAGLNPHNY